MSELILIGQDSKCPGCDSTPHMDQCTECFICKSLFHGYCEVARDTQVGTKTFVKGFRAASTKSNFKFFCDPCVTKFERNLGATESQKITGLEKKINNMEQKLDDITKLLKGNSSQQKPGSEKPIEENLWHDEERYSKVRAPPESSVLVVKNSQTPEQNKQNQKKVQQILIQNKIPVTQSYTNNANDTVMICETVYDRDKLKNLVSDSDNEIVMNSPAVNRPSITIVGMNSQYEKKEIIEMLVVQNGFIRGFAKTNNIHEHIEIFAVRPLKNNQNCFQAFANVSTTLREGFAHFKNKVAIGLDTCKIYDRFHIKRCNNCQHFGHYMNECPTPNDHACGKCGADHNTNDCNSETPKCINCVRGKAENCGHHAFSHECPALKHEQEEKKKRLSNHLNSSNRNRLRPR